MAIEHLHSTGGEIGAAHLELPVAPADSYDFIARQAAQNTVTAISSLEDGFELISEAFAFNSAEGLESHIPIRYFPIIGSIAQLPTFRRNLDCLRESNFFEQSTDSIEQIESIAKRVKVAFGLIIPVSIKTETQWLDAFLDLQIPAGGASVGYLHNFGEHRDVPASGSVFQPVHGIYDAIEIGRFENLYVR